jgi:hypothetical protein
MRTKMLVWISLVLLGAAAPGPAAQVILNEYNAVSGSNRLDGGDGRDAYFGTIFGNGGNWFELLVIEDHVDMRGWNLVWHEDEQVNGETAAGTLTLSNAPLWSDLRSGTLITFIETTNAGGEDGFNTSTNTSFDPAANDWWINVATREEIGKGAAALVTTVTNDGNPGDFSVGRSDWTLTIADSLNNVIFGPAGEGASWGGGGVSGEEGGSLEGPKTDDGSPVTLDMWRAITPASGFYDDTSSTSFGMLNQDYDAMTQVFTPHQDLSALRNLSPMLGNGDFDNDGQLTAADIDALSAHIRAMGNDLKYDVSLDGAVNDNDRQAWVEGLKKTYFGDSNLDLEFSSKDLVDVLAAGQYEDAVDGNSGWAQGDWDGNGDFTTSDFVFALAGGGYEQGPRAAVAAVPEPASIALLACGLLACAGRRRGR